MNRNVSQTAKVLGVDGTLVKQLAFLFKDHLSPDANPSKGKPRSFREADVLVLAYVCCYWDAVDTEDIESGLNQGEHYEDRFREILYRHTPLLQEPPDDLDETWRHGILLCGGGRYFKFELARNYRYVAESMLESALEKAELNDCAYPVLFAYRHTLELSLKVIGEIDEFTHSLNSARELASLRDAPNDLSLSGGVAALNHRITNGCHPFGMKTICATEPVVRLRRPPANC